MFELLTFHISQRSQERSASSLRNPLQVVLLASPDAHSSVLHKVLEAEVINPACAEDDIHTGSQNLLQAFLCDIELAVTDGFKLLRVVY